MGLGIRNLTLALDGLAFVGLPRCVTLLPLECGCATDVISRIPLASQEMPLWEGKVQPGWKNVNSCG